MTFTDDTIYILFRTVLSVCLTLGMMISLTEFRVSKFKLARMLGIYILWIVISSYFIITFFQPEALLKVFLLTISAPAVVITYWGAKDTPSQAVFAYMSQITLSLIYLISINLLIYHLDLSKAMDIALRFLFYVPTILLEWRFLRFHFRNMVTIIPKGWAILAIIPCAFSLMIVFIGLWPKNYLQSPTQIIYLYTLAFLMMIVYIVIFKNLFTQYHTQMQIYNANLMATQISALENRVELTQITEETMRIHRHDLRHKLKVIASLIERGDTKSALEFIGASEEQLIKEAPVKWCQNPILDAILGAYFEQAKQNDIVVETHLSIPEQLPVDVMELSIVFANALENAIKSCQLLPIEERKIIFRCVDTPHLILEIANPYIGEISFDEKGIPMTFEKGHGIGIRSIMSFVERHEALYDFKADEHWFRLRIAIS